MRRDIITGCSTASKEKTDHVVFRAWLSGKTHFGFLNFFFIWLKKKIKTEPIAGRHVSWGPQNSVRNWPRAIRNWRHWWPFFKENVGSTHWFHAEIHLGFRYNHALRASLSKDTRAVLSVWVPRRIHFFLRNRSPKLSNSSRSAIGSFLIFLFSKFEKVKKKN